MEKYRLSEEQMERLLDASIPIPMIMLQCGNPPSVQENVNCAWREIADELGFIWDTAVPCKWVGADKYDILAEPDPKLTEPRGKEE
jgi:hypothetical protein